MVMFILLLRPRGFIFDVFIACGDLFFISFVLILMFSCIFLPSWVLALSVECRPWLSGADPGCRVPTLPVGCQPSLSGSYTDLLRAPFTCFWAPFGLLWALLGRPWDSIGRNLGALWVLVGTL